jgi:hypothetical protein
MRTWGREEVTREWKKWRSFIICMLVRRVGWVGHETCAEI